MCRTNTWESLDALCRRPATCRRGPRDADGGVLVPPTGGGPVADRHQSAAHRVPGGPGRVGETGPTDGTGERHRRTAASGFCELGSARAGRAGGVRSARPWVRRGHGVSCQRRTIRLALSTSPQYWVTGRPCPNQAGRGNVAKCRKLSVQNIGCWSCRAPERVRGRWAVTGPGRCPARPDGPSPAVDRDSGRGSLTITRSFTSDPRTRAMIRLDAPQPATFCDGVTRRDFLHAGALAAARPDPAGLPAGQGGRRRRRTATSTASCCSWSAGRATSTPGT